LLLFVFSLEICLQYKSNSFEIDSFVSFSMKKWLSHIGSYLGGNLVEKVHSPLNGVLYVYHIKGKYLLNAQSTNYSFGELHRGFQKALKHIDITRRPINNCLILGFGCGSVSSILRHELKLNFPITSVEKDPVVLKLGRKYFHTNQFSEHTIISGDAYEFVRQNQQKYDFIVFDIYIDNAIPSNFETDEFLRLLQTSLTEKGIVLYNKDINNAKMKGSVERLEKLFRKHFSKVEKFQVVKNNFFFLLSK
jgi:spermidine synthase